MTHSAETAALLERAIETGSWADWQIALRALRIERGMLTLSVNALPRVIPPGETQP